MNEWNAVDLDSPRGRLLKEKLELEQREQTPEIKCRLHEIRRELSKLEREAASWWREDEKGAKVDEGKRDFKAAALEKLEMQEWAVSSLCKKIGGGNSGYTRAKAAVRELAKQGKIVIYKYGNAERACLADRYTPPPARKSMEELEAEIEQLREALRQVQDWAGLHDNHKRVCAERDQLKAEIAETCKDLDRNAAVIADLEAERNELKAELEVRIEERDQLKAELEAVKADLAAVAEDRDRALDVARLDREQLEAAKAERDYLEGQLSAAVEELVRADASASDSSRDMAELKAEISQLELACAKNKELREELAKAQRELDKSGVMAASFLAALLDSIKVSACLAGTTEQASKD